MDDMGQMIDRVINPITREMTMADLTRIPNQVNSTKTTTRIKTYMKKVWTNIPSKFGLLVYFYAVFIDIYMGPV